MPASLARIYLGGNNDLLNEELKKCLKKSNLEPETKKERETDYRLLVYDLGNSVENPIESFLNDLDWVSNFFGKTCVVLISGGQQDDHILEQYQSSLQPYLNDRKNNLRLIITRDLYHLGKENNITKFENYVCQSISEKKIEVTSDGSEKLYPTSLEDICELIIKSLFITNTSGRSFTALTEEITDLELAYLLKKTCEKKDLEIDLDLSKKSKKETESLMELSIQTQALLNWIPKINFSDAVSIILERCQVESTPEAAPYEPSKPRIEDKPILQKLPTVKAKPKAFLKKLTEKFAKSIPIKTQTQPEIDFHVREERGVLKIIAFAATVILILAAIPLVVSLTSLYLSTKLTYQAFQEIRVGQVRPSQNHLNQAQLLHQLSATTFQTLVPLGNIVSKENVTSTNNYLLVLGHGQSLLSSIIDTYSMADKLYLGLLGKEPADVKVITSALRVNLVSVSEKLSQIQLLFGQISLPFGYSDRLSNTDVNQSINLLKSQINLALPLLDLVEKVGSNQSLQRYLVVVQDINELRGSGGFISTYGVLTFDQGKIIDFQIDSSLSLDRLIEGKIEPPSIVKQLLGQSNWSFHDSNLDADFPGSAKQMSWFYQRFKSSSLDGVIGLNTNLLRFVLEQIGPITLADGQSVSQDNLISLSSNPTASKGLDVVTALTQSLGKKFVSGEIPFAKLARALLKAVAYDEVDLWFNTPSLESLAEASNLAGNVKSGSCHPQLSALNCRADTLYLNESNMSVNKLNYYLKRNQNLSVEITDSGFVNYTASYDYSYPVPAPTDLGGLYKAYYQLYLPASSQNVVITLDTQPLDLKSLVQTSFGALTKIEFSAGESLNQPHHLEVRFTSPTQLDFKKPLLAYSLSLLKQPGTLNDSLTIKLHYPASLLARNLTTPLKQTGANELTFQTNQTSRENIGIIFKNQSL